MDFVKKRPYKKQKVSSNYRRLVVEAYGKKNKARFWDDKESEIC